MKRSEYMLGGEDIKNLKACHAMESNVRFCRPSTPWGKIVTSMVEGGFSSLPVVDSDDNLIGMVRESNLLKVLLEGRDVKKVKAEDVMAKETITVMEDTPFLEVIKILDDNHLIRVPVVKKNKLVGILTRRDLLFCHHRASLEPPHGF